MNRGNDIVGPIADGRRAHAQSRRNFVLRPETFRRSNPQLRGYQTQQRRRLRSEHRSDSPIGAYRYPDRADSLSFRTRSQLHRMTALLPEQNKLKRRPYQAISRHHLTKTRDSSYSPSSKAVQEIWRFGELSSSCRKRLRIHHPRDFSAQYEKPSKRKALLSLRNVQLGIKHRHKTSA